MSAIVLALFADLLFALLGAIPWVPLLLPLLFLVAVGGAALWLFI